MSSCDFDDVVEFVFQNELEVRGRSIEVQDEVSNLMSGLDRALSIAKRRFCQPTEMSLDMEQDPETETLPLEYENDNPEEDGKKGNSLDSSI